MFLPTGCFYQRDGSPCTDDSLGESPICEAVVDVVVDHVELASGAVAAEGVLIDITVLLLVLDALLLLQVSVVPQQLVSTCKQVLGDKMNLTVRLG